jgi:DNA-binding GntR family transcriptional regulator
MKAVGNKKVQVYESLKRRIIDCELVPGLPINEADFATDLGVSKTPIREALRQLERDGFVDSIPGRGSTISHITSSDIREIFEIREIIETGAAKRVAQYQRDDEQLKRKREEHRQFLNSEQGREEYAYEWGEWEDVHLFIIRALGNQTLLKMYDGLLDRIKRIRNNYGRRFTQRRLHEIVAEHLDILDSILEGDPNRAEQSVKKHLQNAGAFIMGLSTAPRQQ